MPQNIQEVSLKEVVKFFIEDVDGFGLNTGPLRNLGVPLSLELCREWKLCELTEKEFMHLTIPDGTGTLIKDKTISLTSGSSKATILNWIRQLEKEQNLPALIARSKLPTDPPNSSFYIEDGAHRAIAYKVYFENNRYEKVKAYLGLR